MISMQVTYENPLDPLQMNMESANLKLCTFGAVDQKEALIYIE
jgi:hypothetical protein